MHIKNETRTDSPIIKWRGTINRELAGFAFFLFITFVFWNVNFPGKDNEASLGYQLKYGRVPANRTLLMPGSSRLYLNLKGTGFAIIRIKVRGTMDPLSIDLSKVTYKRVTGSNV